MLGLLREPYPVDAEGHLEIKNARAILPRTPGLGIQLDKEMLRMVAKTN